jgi:hypothetical protein
MKIQQHTDLHVYKKAFDAAMLIFEESKRFPKEETYSLTDQIRRSSRSVSVRTWPKRGGSSAIRRLSSPSCPTRKAKLLRHRSGSNLRWRAAISSVIALIFCAKRTTRFCGCSLR